MYPRRKKQVVGEMKNADRYWQDRYFFMHVNTKSMGDLANAFYPLWGSLRKELKKPPPKALLFEEKLERLLALPDREWDDIHVPERLRASSLWKDFKEIPSGIPKRVPSWVDWTFVIRGALRRLFGSQPQRYNGQTEGQERSRKGSCCCDSERWTEQRTRSLPHSRVISRTSVET
ncbi:hypothetical protein TIFTF001_028124 [Ficus carica]|uniref:Uncharacterized protein n=1 Tax=Ficus carica TaxID=3494 RepID=A0AA88DPB8_FICCA|nr:hypothetical protein TIFTF001_028124 [Ficus carica]